MQTASPVSPAAHVPFSGYFTPRVLMVALTGLCVFLNVYATQPILPLLATLFQVTKFQASLTVSATALAIALSAPWVGLIAERIGRKHTMAISVAVLTIPTLFAATASGLKTLVMWRFLQGLCMPGIITVTLAYVSEEWASGGASAVMAAYVAGTVLGGVCGRLLSGFIADYWNWRMVFIVLGGLNVLGSAAIWRWLPHSRHFHAAPRLADAFADMAHHLRQRRMLATFCIGSITLFALVGIFTSASYYLAAPPFLLRPSKVGMIFLVYLVGVIFTPIGGQWIEHIGHRRALVIAAIIAAAGIVLTLAQHLPVVAAGLAIGSTGIFLTQAATASYLGHISGRAKASAAGLYGMFYYLGGTVGGCLSFVYQNAGWPPCVILTVASLGVSIVLAITYWNTTESTT
jgi:predicted MFS family arabinose efflux permease